MTMTKMTANRRAQLLIAILNAIAALLRFLRGARWILDPGDG